MPKRSDAAYLSEQDARLVRTTRTRKVAVALLVAAAAIATALLLRPHLKSDDQRAVTVTFELTDEGISSSVQLVPRNPPEHDDGGVREASATRPGIPVVGVAMRMSN